MKKISLIDVDGHNFPNIALMKISAFHKSIGDSVNFHSPLFSRPDKCYVSKIFTFSNDYDYFPNCKIFKGGSGYGVNKLPKEIEKMQPDYSLYNCEHAYGFLTRGCIRNCNFCIVPQKEGYIKENDDIENILQDKFKTAVLMDNNILAHEHGIKQIEKIIRLKIKVDFNQGLDARLIDDSIAMLLSKVKWLKPLRMACDKPSMKKPIEKAVNLLRKYKTTPKNYFVYALIEEEKEALDRIEFLRNLKVDPFAMPYRDFKNNHVDRKLKKIARWVNHKAIFNSVKWEDYNKKELNISRKENEKKFNDQIIQAF
jgi:radical SAM superfamily enzyme YgiQ (UPF0313 family)